VAELFRCAALLLAFAISSSPSPSASAAELPASSQPVIFEIPATAQVDGSGVFLSQLITAPSHVSVPVVRVAAAPALGQAVAFTRLQVNELVLKHAAEIAPTAWSGATQVRVTRRLRALEESELKQSLTDALQREHVKDKGELELRLQRAWTPVMIPDEPFTLRILDLPTAGVSPSFIVRFELRTAQELVAGWQLFVQAKILKEVLVARSQLKRGTKLRDADVTLERRDALALREPLPPINTQDELLELAEFVPAGQPLSTRSVRVRPVVLRGGLAEALVQDGPLSVSIKVEVLEDGIPGQVVRVRNLQTKREFHGKVQNEQTILVSL
jgi:flagella basal body P-ring formation protein FlgA